MLEERTEDEAIEYWGAAKYIDMLRPFDHDGFPVQRLVKKKIEYAERKLAGEPVRLEEWFPWQVRR